MKRLVALTLSSAILSAASTAAAFCRTTTCKDANCSVDANGCPSSGKPITWSRPMPLTFRFQARGTTLLVNEEARAAVRAAFFRWTDVICDGGRTSLRFVEGEDLVADKPLTERGDETASVSPFGIYFRDTGWPHQESNGDGTLALTTLQFGQDSGRLVYADIEINTGGTDPLVTGETAVGIDLQLVVTHEVGHYIGLAHSAATNSVMNAELCANSDRCQRDKVAARRLADDDRAAVCALYPPGATNGGADSSSSSDAGCSSSASQRRDGSGAVAIALALLVGARRLMRRRSDVSCQDDAVHRADRRS